MDQTMQVSEVERLTNAELLFASFKTLERLTDIQRLFEACKKGELSVVKELIPDALHINQKDTEGKTALHHAVIAGHKNIVSWLLEKQADMNAQDENGWTALHYAAKQGSFGMIQALLAYKTIKGLLDSSERWLLDLNVITAERFTALSLASDNDSLEIVWLLLSAGALISWYDYSVLMLAVRRGDAALGKLLIEIFSVNASDGETGKTLLMIAAEKGHVAFIKMLLKEFARVDYRNSYTQKTALHYAAIANQSKAADALIDGGADVHAQDECGNTPLHESATFDSKDVLALLIKRDRPVRVNGILTRQTGLELRNCKGETALHVALNAKNETAAIALITNASIRVKNVEGEYAIHVAVRQNLLSPIKAIIAKDPETVDVPDANGWTALDHAAANGFFPIAKVLVDAEADGGISSYVGAEPLAKRVHLFPIFFALDHNYLDIVRLLISKGTAYSIRKNLQVIMIIFHRAVLEGKSETVQKLLTIETIINNTTSWMELGENPAFNASSDASNFREWTALHYAVWFGRCEIIPILLDKMDINMQNFAGRTPLDLAILSGRFEEARLLVNAKAHMNGENNKERVLSLLLETDCSTGKSSCMKFAKLFMENGASIENVKGINSLNICKSHSALAAIVRFQRLAKVFFGDQ